MKTTVGKVLSVVTAVASVIFLGFVLIATMGGPNWVAEAQNLEGFSFSQTDASPPQWTATQHVGQGNIAPNRAIEPVLYAAYDAKLKDATARQQALEAQAAPLQTAITDSNAAIEKDLAALQKHVDELSALLGQTESEVLTTADQVEAKAEEVRKVELQIQSRRDDVLRLSAQVEEIRADRFRIRSIQQQIRDLIQQIDGSIERAANRRRQLEGRGGSQVSARRTAPESAGNK
jgi:hypothetical protein